MPDLWSRVHRFKFYNSNENPKGTNCPFGILVRLFITNLEREVKTTKKKNLSTRIARRGSRLVRVTGLEPAATSCGARKLFPAWSADNFQPLRHFELAYSHTVSARSQCLTFGQESTGSNSIIQMKIPKEQTVPLGFWSE